MSIESSNISERVKPSNPGSKEALSGINYYNNYFISTNTESNTLLTLKNITKSFKNKSILEDINFNLVKNDKVVLVGENGIGKSTLFRILTQQYQPDSGQIVLNGQIGYLAQDLGQVRSKTVMECLVEHSDNEDLKKLVQERSTNSPSSQERNHEFNSYGGYEFLSLLSELGLKDLDLDQPYEILSGGQKTKVALVSLAVRQPDLLLLDEPTNHLDIQSMKWLDQFLKHYPGAWIVISHDRALINNSANRIFELSPENHQLVSFKGGYHDYLIEKEKEYQRLKQSRDQLKKNLHLLSSKLDSTHQSMRSSLTSSDKSVGRSDQDKLTYNFKSGCVQKSYHSKTHQIQSKISSLKNQISDLPLQRGKFNLEFKDNEIDEDFAISISNISFSYPQIEIFNNFSLAVRNKSRLIITGSNGIGKSTLLKLIAGLIEIQEGNIKIAGSGTVGYLDQEQESILPDLTAIEYCSMGNLSSTRQESIYGQLKKLGIVDGLDLSQQLKHLSIGRQRKVQLAKMLLKKPNILLLDEPTNHIDLLSVEEIETQLVEFPGAIVAVSHDRWFIDKVATQVINLDDCSLN